MTPKEKAIELFNKYFYLDCKAELDTYVCTDREYSKQCALIAVDEALKQFTGIFNNLNQVIDMGILEYSANYKYWQEVKNEINLL